MSEPSGPPDSDGGRAELLGVRIEGVGPIRRCFLPLDHRFIVLYGLNGAGKTHVLSALSAAFGPDPELGDGRVDLHVLSGGLSLAQTSDPDPWDPWQALWTGVLSYIRESIPRRETPISIDRLTLDFARHHVIGALEGIIGEPLVSPNLFPDLSQFIEIVAQLMISVDPNSYINHDSESEEAAFDAGAEPFWPIWDAIFEGRLIVRVTGAGRRTVLLGRAQEGEATESWAERLRGFIGSTFDLGGAQRVLDEVLRLISEIKDPAALEAIQDSIQARSEEVAARRATEDPAIGPTARFERDGAEAFFDELWDEYGLLAHCLQWDSVFAAELGIDPWPAWVADPVLTEGDDPGAPPVGLIDESTEWVELATVQRLLEARRYGSPFGQMVKVAQSLMAHTVDSNRKRQRRRRERTFEPELVVIDNGSGSVSADPELAEIASRLEEASNRIFATVLPRSPRLVCRVAPIYTWSESGPLDWAAIDASGAEVSLESLSGAENRWAVFSIRLADLLEVRSDGSDVIVLIDEPERALHRRAEQELADALVALSDSLDIRFVVASHSPAFLAHRQVGLQHVRRAADGTTVVEAVPQEFFDRSDELGLNPADLLQLCRAMLLVEGQHEIAILDELIGDELRRLGVEMLCMRGATSLKAWDAQLVQRYTDVPFVVLVDNDRAGRLHDIWTRARAAAEGGGDHFRIIDELKSGSKGSEGEFLRELCKNLIVSSDPDRYHITALSEPDIPEYLPPEAIAPAAQGRSWEELRREAGAKSSSTSQFKAWMKTTYGADYSDANLRAAAQTMDSIPQDLTDLLDHLARIVVRR